MAMFPLVIKIYLPPYYQTKRNVGLASLTDEAV
jgi:hypothetical protein